MREEHGSDAVMVSASPKLTNEELYVAGRFARAGLGVNNLASFHRLVNGGDYHALDEMLGGTFSTVSLDEVLAADLYLIVGCNPPAENPVLGWKIKRRMRQGAKAIVINSSEIDLVKHATVWADGRRGTATVLLNGLVAELLRQGHVDSENLRQTTANFEAVKDSLAKPTLPNTSSLTGVSLSTLREAVQLLATPGLKVVAIYNLDSRMERAVNDLPALANLLLVTGKLGQAGSGLALLSSQCNNSGLQLAGFDPKLAPGGLPLAQNPVLPTLSKLWSADLSFLETAAATNLSRKIWSDKIRAAFLFGENPLVAPEYHAFITNLEFRVVADVFLTETGRAADVFLPLSTFLESDGHFTNWSGLKQRVQPIAKPQHGWTTRLLIQQLSKLAGHNMDYPDTNAVTSELDALLAIHGLSPRLSWTHERQPKLLPCAEQMLPTPPQSPLLVEIDARMAVRLQSIKG